jgi:hypothetical protein
MAAAAAANRLNRPMSAPPSPLRRDQRETLTGKARVLQEKVKTLDLNNLTPRLVTDYRSLAAEALDSGSAQAKTILRTAQKALAQLLEVRSERYLAEYLVQHRKSVYTSLGATPPKGRLCMAMAFINCCLQLKITDKTVNNFRFQGKFFSEGDEAFRKAQPQPGKTLTFKELQAFFKNLRSQFSETTPLVGPFSFADLIDDLKGVQEDLQTNQIGAIFQIKEKVIALVMVKEKDKDENSVLLFESHTGKSFYFPTLKEAITHLDQRLFYIPPQPKDLDKKNQNDLSTHFIAYGKPEEQQAPQAKGAAAAAADALDEEKEAP